MPQTRRTLLRIAAAGGVGLLAGCTGGSDGAQGTTDSTMSGDGTETTAGPANGASGYTVEVRTHPEYGVLLTDAEGMTLYLFTEDQEGQSVCYDQCADAWPPLTVDGEPSIPEGLPGSFETTERDGGATQLTYGGWPLYYFASDEGPGDATGQGVNDVWFVVRPTCPGESVAPADTGEEGTGTEETTTGGTTGDSSSGGGPY